MTYQIVTPTHRPKIAGQTGPVVPQSVRGFYRRLKWGLLVMCLCVYYVLPFLRWNRGASQPDQAILFDLADVRFYLFGIEARAQELIYLTGLLVLATVILVLMNAVAGRIWCGFFCPQTIWSDLFLAVERFFEGDRREQLIARGKPMTVKRAIRLVAKHGVWLAIAAATGGAFVLYFADAPTLLTELFTGKASALAYGITASLTFTTYALAGFAREKVCTFMCPWPRLQGAIWDGDALTVNYRDPRGEPRMSAKKAELARVHFLPAGDCVDCNACVTVCPMGIDIRNGPSIACINCGLCVDACDTTMGKLGRDRGLIDYESWRNIERERKGEQRQPVKVIRPKTLGLAAAALVLIAVMSVHFATRSPLALTVIHDRNPIAVRLSDGTARNSYEVRISNLETQPAVFELHVTAGAPLSFATPGLEPSLDGAPLVIDVPGDDMRKLRVSVTGPSTLSGDIQFTITRPASGEEVSKTDRFHQP
ncbi:cytochrome c oxidase accessory protein CcoG [Roseibium suaedae]|uniref:Cytochrome c oxidase accessory protein FixG n=1 Tax=Roseibium suaedae TaxID=735517 RepID=A0A1M7NX05_9HYPH|nr:cytochrome c oxidase accessory protein CcoG [Roseibium suaedae]SHN08657.1 cytochrome c oxidase accessory protein FixG [Roseibium suaedae]